MKTVLLFCFANLLVASGLKADQEVVFFPKDAPLIDRVFPD
jgi:hypothetical protein